MPTSRRKKKSPVPLCSPVFLCVKDFDLAFALPNPAKIPVQLLILLAAVALHSQTAPNSVATFQAKARVVIEDIVVTNSKGEPIPGLHKEDFEISEDSTPQTIATFEEHQAATVTPFKLPPMPPHVYTNFPLIEKADSLNVLLLDSLNTPVADQNYVHQQMIKYLATIPPGTRVAVFTLASRLRMLQGATTDSSLLLAVLNEKKAGTHASPLLASNAETDADKEHINFMESESMSPAATNLTNVQAAVDPVNSIKQFLADTTAYETDSRTRLTLDSLQQLARYLSDTPGRKNVLWFSGSFPTGILPNPDLPDPSSVVRSFEPEVRRTTALLASSQVALYPIAAEGLSTDSTYQVNGGAIGQKRPSYEERDLIKQMKSDSVTRDSNHTVMEMLAEDTGGTAFYNTNGLSDALARVINNGTRYYTLTYTPADKNMDGKFRHIHVKLRDNKYKLAYRRGYFADPVMPARSGQKADNDPLMPFMARNFPDLSQIVYKISVVPAKTQPAPDAPRAGANQDLKGPVTRYVVDFAVAVQDLKLDPTPDGGRHGNIEVMLIAYDRDGKPINMVITKGDLTLQPKIYASMIKLGLQMHKEIDVPQQPIYLRTGIYDLNSDSAGTLGIPLTDSTATPTTAAK